MNLIKAMFAGIFAGLKCLFWPDYAKRKLGIGHKLQPYSPTPNPYNFKFECEICNQRFKSERHANYFLCEPHHSIEKMRMGEITTPQELADFATLMKKHEKYFEELRKKYD